MLVRFLSYAASVIGARRYKPLLISCLAVILSITGITIVASSLAGPSKEQISGIGGPTKDITADQQATNDLGGLDKKQTKDGAAGSSIITPDPSTSADGETGKTPPTANTADKSLDVTLNSATINLSAHSPNAAVTVTANSTTAGLTWSVLPEGTAGTKLPTAQIEPSKDSSAKAVIRFRAEDSPVGTYVFTVTVKDNLGQLSASKTITVVVN